MMSDTQITIIGAGPTGLILANELLRRGITVRQVDMRPTPSGSTRAFTIHSRTMEMFDHIGVAPRLQEIQEICPGNRFHFKELQMAHDATPATDFRRLQNTRFNYYGKINQNDLEQVMRDHLLSHYGHVPEWNVECIGIDNREKQVTATLIHHDDNKREETFTTAWLIGADGVRSVVRGHLGGSFEHSESYMTTMSMADVKLRGYNGDDSWVNYYTSNQGFLLLTHLPGDVHRIYLTGEMQQKLEQMELKDAYQWGLDFYETEAKIDEVCWASTWQIHKIIGEVYYKGHAILCGDATHVHSPSGGQGMNACLQDAFNLGWKLAAILNNDAPESLLASYESERKPIAKQVTEGANRIHQIVINHDIPVEERYTLTQDPDWHDGSIYWISGLAHTYRDFAYIPEGVSRVDSPVQTGDRAPDVILSAVPPKRRLYDILRHPKFTALFLPGSNEQEDISSSHIIATQLSDSYEQYIKAILIAEEKKDIFDFDHMFLDKTGEIREVYGLDNTGRLILVRPDLVVAFQSTLKEADKVFDYLKTVFNH